MLRLRCRRCGAEYRLPDGQGEEQLRCVECGAWLGGTEEEPARVTCEDAAKPAAARSAPRRHWARWLRGVRHQDMLFDYEQIIDATGRPIPVTSFYGKVLLVLLALGAMGALPFTGAFVVPVIFITILPRMKRSYERLYRRKTPGWLVGVTVCTAVVLVCWQVVLLGWLWPGRRW